MPGSRTVAPITFAHRGARLEEPENTLAAFRAALRAGATGLETDAWSAADGEVVLTHDSTVGRGLRRRRVPALRAEELAAYAVPRLVELYEQLGSDYELSVDVKDPQVARPLVQVARAAGAISHLWVCSPDLALLRSLADEPGVRRVHSTRRRNLGTSLERHAADLAVSGIDAMNLHHTEWTAGLVSLFQRFGLRAFAWDAQEVRHLRAVLRMGVDAVYCDRPARMVEAVAAWAAEDR